ncbi:MAG TPA: hypothetical protein VM737_05220, partial [Gemmatimonadota bacterium]|nr:hypothetical protein [Gemmatimonadota bacterium]
MSRTPIFLAALAAGFLFIGCSDRGASPSGPESGLIVSDHDEALAGQIRELIDDLFPETKEKNNLNRAANNQFDAAEKACHQKSQEECTEKVFSLIDFVNEKHDEGKLLDPDGPQTTDEGVFELNLLLLQFAGFDVPDFSDVPEDATDFNVQPCLDPAEVCLAIVPSGFSGVFLPEFACDGPCVLVAFRYDETNFFPTDGPLPTDLDQFPLFYDWAKYEVEEGGVDALGAARSLGLAQGEFNVPVEVALCVVEEGAYAPADEIEGRLELAHPDPDNPDEIEFGIDNGNSPNVPIECPENLSGGDPPTVLTGLAPAGERRLTLASPGKLGSAFTAMSPFAAVDPESGESVSVSGFDGTRSRAPLDGGTGFDGTSTLVNALLDPDNFGASGT